jgi:hypothetical protein
MEQLDWDKNFDPAYGKVLMMPSKYIYYRGYDPKYPVISNRPAYFGSLKTASGYAERCGGVVNAFTNKNYITLIDVRFMKDILRNLFQEYDHEDDERILSVLISFGISSLAHQIKLADRRFAAIKDHESMKSLRDYYKSGLMEQQGFRLAETHNDAETMGFLQSLFEGFVDGFISPRQFSPFHVEKPNHMLNAEMIIFNPENSGISILPDNMRIKPEPPTPIKWFYNKDLKRIHLGDDPSLPYNFHMKGGADPSEIDAVALNTIFDTQLPIVEQINMAFSDDPAIQEAWNRGLESGVEWRKLSRLGELINPHPTCPGVRSWKECEEIWKRKYQRKKTRRLKKEDDI